MIPRIYIPDNIHHLEVCLALFVLFVLPLLLTALCGAVGWLFRRRRLGVGIGCALSVVAVLLYGYGTLVGFSQLEVTRLELAFDDLPEAFDGYRIVQFSDAHVGTFVDRREALLRRAVDTINAQHADAVVFTGDLQNKRVQEVEDHKALLSSIKARDGVFSVLGNHDYAEYLGTDDPAAISRQLGRSRSIHKDLGWTLLANSRRRLRRDSATLVIAGMENDGEGRFPQLGELNSALYGVSRREFVVMLEHDPTSWRRKILPHSHVQLTLSGHTHDGQFSLFGWSPARLVYRECAGLYEAGPRKLYVSRGLGGVIPFRLGAPAEIVVITLKRK